MSMLDKHHGRKRVHNVLAKSGYGRDGAKNAADGGRQVRTDGLRRQIAEIEASTAEGGTASRRLDRKPRSSGGRPPKKDFNPGGEKGKLHREMGIPVGQKIPVDKLMAATHSSDPEKRKDAIRAETMKKWNHGKK